MQQNKKILNIEFKDKVFQLQAPDNFEQFLELLHNQLQPSIQGMLSLRINSDYNERDITDQQEWEEFLKSREDYYVLKVSDQILSLQKQDSEDYFNQSILEQKNKFSKLKEQIEQNKKRQLEEFTLEESIFKRKDEDLSISYIMNYYRDILCRFEKNYSAQTSEHKNQNEQLYLKYFQSICVRLNQKLNDYFILNLKKDQIVKINEPKYSKEVIDKAKQLATLFDEKNYEVYLKLVEENKNKSLNEIVQELL